MTNHISNINSLSTANNMLQSAVIDKIKKHFNQNKNTQLLVLNLEDLNADIINQLKQKQCKMMLLNSNFKVLEHTQPNQIQLKIDGCRKLVSIKNIIRFEASGSYTYGVQMEYD